MKMQVAPYQTKVYFVRIEPANDHPIIRICGYPTDLTMTNGEVYLTENGYEFSGYGTTATFASSSIDLSGILSMGAISKVDLESGVYDNARVYLFAASFNNLVEDYEPLGLMFWGKVNFSDDNYTVQLMQAIDVLGQSTGRTYSPSCPWVLFDQTLDGHVLQPSQSRCTGPRANPDGPLIEDFKVTGTLTSVTSQYAFADSARTEVDDYFGYGAIRFITGDNAGLKPLEIKSYLQAGGQIAVIEAFFFAPKVGDQYEMIPGCRKRPNEDCRDKYSNKINFGGQDFVPNPSEYGQIGRN